MARLDGPRKDMGCRTLRNQGEVRLEALSWPSPRGGLFGRGEIFRAGDLPVLLVENPGRAFFQTRASSLNEPLGDQPFEQFLHHVAVCAEDDVAATELLYQPER